MKKLVIFLSLLLLLGCAGMQQKQVDWEEQEAKRQQLEEDIRAATMSGAKWSSYGTIAYGSVADGDDLLLRDSSDTALGPTGTQKRLTFSGLKSYLESISEFGFPYGTNPTIDEDAEAAVDTTDGQLVVYLNSADRVLTYKYRQCYTLEDPADADDGIPIFSLDDGFTVTRIDCMVSGGTSAVINLSDGTNFFGAVTCGTTMTSDTTLSNATFTALESLKHDTGTVTGAVDWVNVCFTYTITRE